MALRRGFGPAHPELEPFLLAEIGDDRNGLPVTVQSALARMDRDPESEAARISAQPRDAAVRSVTGLIEALPEGSWTKLDAREIASDLLARLPQGRLREAPATADGANSETVRGGPMLRILLCAALAALVAFAIWGMPTGMPNQLGMGSSGADVHMLAASERFPDRPEGAAPPASGSV